MIIKIKDIARKGISLVLALTMMMPTGVYAGNHTVNSWDAYKEKLKSDIMKQEPTISINFSSSEIFSTEYYARLKIADAYEEVIENVPKQVGELNIKSNTTLPVLDGVSNVPLKSVTHTIVYKNSAAELLELKGILGEEYKTIKTFVTDYEKVKAAYKYVIEALSNDETKKVPRINDIFFPIDDADPQDGEDAHAVLFAMMMTELGYDNDIATGTGVNAGRRWNLVKVQGKWYHVDGKSENIGELEYNNLLKVKESGWNIEEHKDKLLAVNSFDGTIYTVLQLRYEIELLETEIDKTDKDITAISSDSISVAQVRETKEKLKAIEDKVKNYQERKTILEVEVNKSENSQVKDEFDDMAVNIEAVNAVLTAKKAVIVNGAISKAESTFKITDISIAKEALTMVDDTDLVVEKMIALEKAIVAIEKAEKSKLAADILAAKTTVEDSKIVEYKIKLDTRIEELEGTIAVGKAETTRTQADVTFAKGLVDALDTGDLQTSLWARLRIVQDEINANDAEQTRINTARLAVEAVEAALKADNPEILEIEDLISIAQTEIANIETETTKKPLEIRINNAEVAKNAIKSVNEAKDSISGTVTAIDLEASIQAVETAVKTIKDTSVKAAQQKRINTFKIVLTAIKAVEKAENTVPQKTTYVTSAKTAIGKISEEYQDIINKLNDRLVDVENSISAINLMTKAEMAVQKAEKSMKLVDLDLARDAVGLLPADKRADLYARIRATDRVVHAEISLAKYLGDPSEVNKEVLVEKINEADLRVNQLKADDANKPKLQDKVKGIENSKDAIEAIEAVKSSIANDGEEDINKALEVAETAVAKVTDSIIKKQLENKLKTIVSERDATKKLEEANKAVDYAEFSLKAKELTDPIVYNGDLIQNKEAVAVAQLAVSKLPTSSEKTNLQNRIKVLNNAIKAKEAVENAERKSVSTLVEKDIIAAEKALTVYRGSAPDDSYIPGLEDKVVTLRENLKAYQENDLLNKAIEAVEKAKETKLTKDISAAWNAVNLVKAGTDIAGNTKASLTTSLNNLERSIATEAVVKAESSANLNSTSLSKDITSAKNSVEAIRNKEGHMGEIENLITRINTLNRYVALNKVVVNAEKTINDSTVSTAESELVEFDKIIANEATKDLIVYANLRTYINDRIVRLRTTLGAEETKLVNAQVAVDKAEKAMIVVTDEVDGTKTIEAATNEEIQNAQKLVDLVTDKNLRAGFQKRINDILTVKEVIAEVNMAVAYPNEDALNAADTALKKIGIKYGPIRGKLKDDIEKARAVLNESKSEAYALANEQLKLAETEINGDGDLSKPGVNFLIASIKEGPTEDTDIEAANARILEAENYMNKAKAAALILTDQQEQKTLLTRINSAKGLIDVARDNLNVKKATKLLRFAANSVNYAISNKDKPEALLAADTAINNAKLAISGIIYDKEGKNILSNGLKTVENRLTTDSDQTLINAAFDKIKKLAESLSKAMKDGNLEVEKTQLESAITTARLEVGLISDKNKAAKNTLNGYLNDIEEALKTKIHENDNGKLIRMAEEAVDKAEEVKEKDPENLSWNINMAQLKVNMIKIDGPDAQIAKPTVDSLNARLAVLRGESGGTPSNPGNSGGNNSGGNKPGGDTTPINVIPTTPLSDKDRVIGTTEPKWGKTKELKKANPTTGITTQDMKSYTTEFKTYESQLSNMLNTKSSENATLVVRGKNIKLDSKPYINDKINNSILLPIKTLGDELGFTVSLIDSPVSNGAKRLLINGFVYGASKSIIMDIGSEYCYVNGILVKISSKPVIQEGKTYVPVDFMVEHLGLSFSYYNQNGTIQLIIN